jgi:hypothetical protein
VWVGIGELRVRLLFLPISPNGMFEEFSEDDADILMRIFVRNKLIRGCLYYLTYDCMLFTFNPHHTAMQEISLIS